MLQERPLNVLMMAAEIVPFVKVGGLADVVGARATEAFMSSNLS